MGVYAPAAKYALWLARQILTNLLLRRICRSGTLPRMKLREYLEWKGLRQRAFARELGVSDAYISRLIAGQRKPRAKMALKIEAITDGAVTLRDLFGDPLPLHRRPRKRRSA